jgi:hypothetical protein
MTELYHVTQETLDGVVAEKRTLTSDLFQEFQELARDAHMNDQATINWVSYICIHTSDIHVQQEYCVHS